MVSVSFHALCRQKVCCGIIYKGRFGEVLIDPHLFKPCCRNKRQQQQQQQQKQQQQQEEEEEEEEDEEEEVEAEEGRVCVEKSQMGEEVKEIATCGESAESAQLHVASPPVRSEVVGEEGW